MKNSFDRIITAAPVNKTAAIVAYGKGESWDPRNKITQAHWEAPPKCDPLPRGVEDFSGAQTGRLTVIRYFASHKRIGALWLVRCSCGDYETRRTGAFVNPNNSDDRCSKCRHLEFVTGGQKKRRDQTRVSSRIPLPTKPFTPNGAPAEDLTGKQIGSLLVCGCALKPPGSTTGSKWVVRCTCGNYEHKSGKVLRRMLRGENLDGAMCDDCHRRLLKQEVAA
jgi:hypothetical protein